MLSNVRIIRQKCRIGQSAITKPYFYEKRIASAEVIEFLYQMLCHHLVVVMDQATLLHIEVDTKIH